MDLAERVRQLGRRAARHWCLCGATGTRDGEWSSLARVLVIDDDPQVRGVVEDALSQAGHTVVLTRNGREGLRALQEGKFDLVITDIFMPDMEGIELLRLLRTEGTSIPVVAMSGGGIIATEAILSTAAKLGACATLEKPFGPADLAAAVARALGEPGD